MVNQTQVIDLQQLKVYAKSFLGFAVVQVSSTGSMILAKHTDGRIESYFVEDLVNT